MKLLCSIPLFLFRSSEAWIAIDLRLSPGASRSSVAPSGLGGSLSKSGVSLAESSGGSGVLVEDRLLPRCLEVGKLVEIPLCLADDGDGDATRYSYYKFHAMWLRDACRDSDSIVPGERNLKATPVGPLSHVDPTLLAAQSAEWEGDDELIVTWNDASPNIRTSRFTTGFLTRYAPLVAQRSSEDEHGSSTTTATTRIESSYWCKEYDIPKWLEPYTGFPDAPAPTGFEAWNEAEEGGDQFRRFDHGTVMTENAAVLDVIHELLNGKGVALIDNVPDTIDATELTTFIQHCLGGLQKDPTRAEANWKIVHTPGAASISYDPAKRLYQHTDSSIPPHGIPALVLSMHYVQGYGANTLTDGYAVAEQLRQVNPHGFQLLCEYGYDGERDFAASRADSTQTIAKGLVVPRKHPIFVTDRDGSNNVCRLQYNEVFRIPLTLPFDVFPDWFAAFSQFVQLLHEREVTVDMQENTILLMNNWRVLHGRAGNRASPDRHVVGGTILRESVYSRAMQLARHLRIQQETDSGVPSE